MPLSRLCASRDLAWVFFCFSRKTQILDKGEIQVSEKERTIMLESLFKDIATVVSEKCVDPSTKRPIPVGNVERAMRDMHYSVNPHRNAKQQALEVIRLLKERIPIERAQMQLKIVGPAAASKVCSHGGVC